MIKTKLYTYLGTNGTLVTPIHLPNIYSIKKYSLTADKGKKLTLDGKTFVYATVVEEAEIDKWYEVED